MDGLDDFEKALAAEKGERERIEREKEERRQRKKHRHSHSHRDERDEPSERHRDKDRDRHRSHGSRRHDGEDDERRHRRHRSRHHEDDDDNGHRHKRSRRERDDDASESRHKRRRDDHHKTSDPKEDLPLPDEEKTPEIDEKSSAALVRDAWMTAPSALDVDYVHRREKDQKPPPKDEPPRVVHEREINKEIDVPEASLPDTPAERTFNYKFGDSGSQWRLMKLKAVYTAAEQSGRTPEDVALERFGDLREFDDAREEKSELDRRQIYGEGYVGKEQPTGELYEERMAKLSITRKATNDAPEEPEQGVVIPDEPMQHTPMDQTTLNRLRAQMVKAKLMRAPNAAQLESEYNAAAASFATKGPQSVTLGAQDNRMLAGSRGEVKAVETKRGRERGNVEANDDMTIEDMVREERRTRGQAGGEGARLAERIAKDGKFDDDLEYLDENADKLAKRVHKSEINLKNVAVNEYQKLSRILDNCPLCYHEDKNQQPLAPVLSLGTRVYLTLATEPEVSPGGAVIAPLTHRKNLLECDDDEWEELRNFMKSLTRMYHDKGQEVIFYENAAAPYRHLHAAMIAVPIPYGEGAMVPAYFKEAFLSADEEWAQHRKVIDTGAKAAGGMGRMAFRRSIAKEMPYFHVWFTLDGGLGHIIENSDKWPRGDLFAREIVGGIMDVGPDVVKKQGRWRRDDTRVEGFQRGWRKFDWTRLLAEG
ncbi:Pre-mRNA-splicing factor cwf19 like protein [Verticillium longisporum]|nr:Pre-mRNA-splicing factor cwf19 like protein [Verticillium longisporum]